MSRIGWHASHELHPPDRLLRLAKQAEAVGFRQAMCSDHFHPWTPTQGQSGYSFAWLGAALGTTALGCGTVCDPAGRGTHPAIVAQAAATLAVMFPGRFWLAVGTGQALNESITGRPWPDKAERQAILTEAVEMIRALWAGVTVTRAGRVRVEHARLYTRPEEPLPLFGAAVTADTARWVGAWADGLLTVSREPAELTEVIDAFRSGGGNGKPVYAQAAVCYAATDDEAWEQAARNWPVAALDMDATEDLPTPDAIARATAHVGAADLRGRLRVSSDPGQHAAWIQGDLTAGADRVYLHHVGDEPERFLDHVGGYLAVQLR